MKTIRARGIVIKDKSVLLMYREKNGDKYYSIPGGGTEPNETIEETAVREVFEETSIKVKPLKYLGKFEGTDDDKEQHLFLCEYISGEPNLGKAIEMEKMQKDPTNFYKPGWMDIKDVFKWKIRPDPCEAFFKDLMKEYLDK